MIRLECFSNSARKKRYGRAAVMLNSAAICAVDNKRKSIRQRVAIYARAHKPSLIKKKVIKCASR